MYVYVHAFVYNVCMYVCACSYMYICIYVCVVPLALWHFLVLGGGGAIYVCMCEPACI